MLKTLILENFQAHGSLSIELDPRVTTIVGPTDAGKSAVIRALRWACLNQPQGEAFIKDGQETAKVTLIADNTTVARARGKVGNLYQQAVDFAGLEMTEFRAFGYEVPAPIAEALKVSEINFADQHDPPFWLALSPAEVSRRLNAVVDLEIIDKALGHASRRALASRQRTETAEETLKMAKERRDSRKWVLEAAEDWARVERLQKAAEDIRADRADILDLVVEANDHEADAKTAKQYREDGEAVLAMGNVAAELHEQMRALTTAVVALHIHLAVKPPPSLDKAEAAACKYETTKAAADAIDANLRAYSDATATKPPPDLEPVERVMLLARRAYKARRGLERLVLDARQQRADVAQTQDKLNRAKEEFNKVTRGQACPTCGKVF